MSNLSFGKKLILLGVLVMVVLAGLHFSAANIERLTPLAAAVRDVLSPVQRLVMAAGREISDFFSFPIRLVKLSQRNRALEQQLGELRGTLLQYEEIRAENSRLKELLDFKTSLSPQLTTEAAAVIGRDYDNWFGTIIINKGAADGIRRNMAVITPAGLVGRVIRVSDGTAEVLLITDPRSGVGSLVQETRAPGIVEGVVGGQGKLHMIHIPADLAPKRGYRVITSGLGSIFPKGIPIGIVLEIRKEESGLFKMAVVDAYVDFNRLEEVLVVTSPVHPAAAENARR